jgi:hypothetical protein
VLAGADVCPGAGCVWPGDGLTEPEGLVVREGLTVRVGLTFLEGRGDDRGVGTADDVTAGAVVTGAGFPDGWTVSAGTGRTTT